MLVVTNLVYKHVFVVKSAWTFKAFFCRPGWREKLFWRNDK